LKPAAAIMIVSPAAVDIHGSAQNLLEDYRTEKR
jgi:hypothetical protein